MVAVHQRLGYALVVVVAVGALMALVSALRGGPPPWLRAFARYSTMAFGLQVLLGLLLLATGHRPAQALHYVYAGVALLAVPAGIAAGARGDARREAWCLCLAMLGATLVAARAVGTGG